MIMKTHDGSFRHIVERHPETIIIIRSLNGPLSDCGAIEMKRKDERIDV